MEKQLKYYFSRMSADPWDPTGLKMKEHRNGPDHLHVNIQRHGDRKLWMFTRAKCRNARITQLDSCKDWKGHQVVWRIKEFKLLVFPCSRASVLRGILKRKKDKEIYSLIEIIDLGDSCKSAVLSRDELVWTIRLDRGRKGTRKALLTSHTKYNFSWHLETVCKKTFWASK